MKLGKGMFRRHKRSKHFTTLKYEKLIRDLDADNISRMGYYLYGIPAYEGESEEHYRDRLMKAVSNFKGDLNI